MRSSNRFKIRLCSFQSNNLGEKEENSLNKVKGRLAKEGSKNYKTGLRDLQYNC